MTVFEGNIKGDKLRDYGRWFDNKNNFEEGFFDLMGKKIGYLNDNEIKFYDDDTYIERTRDPSPNKNGQKDM